MNKRSFTLFLSLLLIAIFANTALAQGDPYVGINSPGNGAVVSIEAALPVSVTFGNAPEGATGLLLRAYDSNGSVVAQDQGDVSQIPWNAILNFGDPPITPGTTGYLQAYMVDSSTGDRIATSAPVNVTYGSAQPQPTATSQPTNTPQPTPTQPVGQPSIVINSPANGAQVDPNGVPVNGSVSNMPAGGATIIVRLRNANGDTLGDQGLVPDPNQPNQNFNANVGRNTPGVPVTNGGSVIAFLIMNNTVIATSNSVSLVFPGAPPQAALHIASPVNGTTLNRNNPIVVSGTSTGIPAGTVVQVSGFANNALVAQGSGQVNGAGAWSATLQFVSAVNPGVGGSISAAATVNNVQVNSNSVTVFWGSGTNPPGQPFIQISSPPQGSVVGGNGVPINISGSAGNLFENALTVRALDTFGNILAQQPVVADVNGFWQTQLFVNNVAPGTPGTLYAFATSANNGAVVASARVGVTYAGQCFIRTDWPIYVVQSGDTLLKIAGRVGSTVTELAYANCIPNANIVYVGQQLRVPRLPIPTPAPTQVQAATLRILTPVQGAQLDASQRVVVAGAGRALVGNNVVVRALDASGNLLAQQITQPGPAGANGESVWQVSLGFDAENVSSGSIYAFVQSPTTGQVLADALVNVTFNAPIVVTPPSPQQVVITQPTSDLPVTTNGQLQVTGQVMGPYDGDLLVRVLDSQGNVIAEVPAQVSQPDAQGNATWTALLLINVTPGTRGTIFAYISAPFTADPMSADSVNVVFGQPDNSAYVTITNPMPYATLDTTQPIQVAGRGGRLFEGSLTVRALDSDGNVLAEQTTTVNSPNAGTGGEGNWQAALQVNVPLGTRGSIIAFSTSAQNGSIAAFASVYVTFGDATGQANSIRINTPLPGTLVDPAQTLMIAGVADRTGNNGVKVQILDDQGNVLVEQPRALNQSPAGTFGVWQMPVQLRGMAAGTHLRITALATSGSGATVASDSVDIIVGQGSQQGS